MNDANTKIKQQIVEKIKSSANILITVSRNPTVDDLSAALGLAAMLNKLDKHATAIFSGSIPPAITFLDPQKTFENNVDSLRDFIIALDKEKADHLRYKVEGDLVRIFITPYRTTITNEDLEFSHGDFNVDLVLALEVSNKEDFDTAIEAHGNILQDVTVISLSSGAKTSQLGNIDWHDDAASSLCEMIADIGEAIKSEKPLLDKQVATALLTGIVFATDRFSNEKTSPKVMSIAAQLMAAGADQQLIASSLREAHEINSLKYNPVISRGGEPISPSVLPPKVDSKPVPTGALSIKHDIKEPVITTSPVITLKQPEKPVDNTLANVVQPPKSGIPVINPLEPVVASTLPPVADEKLSGIANVIPPVATPEPMLPTPPSISPEQAAEDAKREIEELQNKVMLNHSYMNNDNATDQGPSPINSIGGEKEVDSVDIFNDQPIIGGVPKPNENALGQTAATINPPSEMISNTTESTLPPQAPTPIIDLPMPPPLPDFSTIPPASSMPAFVDGAPQQTISPDLSTLPPQPEAGDMSQFKIPGQS